MKSLQLKKDAIYIILIYVYKVSIIRERRKITRKGRINRYTEIKETQLIWEDSVYRSIYQRH